MKNPMFTRCMRCSRRVLRPTTAILAMLFFVSCRKDITVPDPSVEKLFGKWEWVESNGGLAGHTISPGTEGYTQQVEFRKNGIFKTWQDGKKTNRMTFTLEKGESVVTQKETFLIKFTTTGRKKIHAVPSSFWFSGSDTLFLTDECFDCFTKKYVKIE